MQHSSPFLVSKCVLFSICTHLCPTKTPFLIRLLFPSLYQNFTNAFIAKTFLPAADPYALRQMTHPPRSSTDHLFFSKHPLWWIACASVVVETTWICFHLTRVSLLLHQLCISFSLIVSLFINSLFFSFTVIMFYMNR